MSALSVSYLSVLTDSCAFTAQETVWLANPGPIPIELLQLSFDLYFDNPHGVCLAGYCYYAPASHVFLAHVSVPNAQPQALASGPHALPVTLPPAGLTSVAIPLSGSSNELCFRLADEYKYYGVLNVTLASGRVLVGLGEFAFAVHFGFETVVRASSPPCNLHETS